MRIVILNQAFVPDTIATGQHAADLAVALASAGHEVKVITSRRAYDNPRQTFASREIWKGVQVVRVPCTGFGKAARWRRALDFATFLSSCVVALTCQPRMDVVVAMTTPPLIGVIAAILARPKGAQLVQWIMDLNPDEAIAAGWLGEDSAMAAFLESLLRFSLLRSDRVIVLDEFMRRRILDKRVPGEKVVVIPPWSHDQAVQFDSVGRARFRTGHGLENKFVVMYSGNHSPCHPLDTLLEAARTLSDNPEIAFCFIGGGSEFGKVKAFAHNNGLTNILYLPYRTMEELPGALSAADLHAVVMGDSFVGILHPCKVYNILSLGIPFLYIGPEPSHVTALVGEEGKNQWAFSSRHGEVERVVGHILEVKARVSRRSNEAAMTASNFSSSVLLPRFIEALNLEREDLPERTLEAKVVRQGGRS